MQKVIQWKVFGRTHLIFGQPDFPWILSPDFVFPHFCEGNCREQSFRKIPTKPAKFYTTKISNIFLQRGRAKKARAISAAVSLARPELQVSPAGSPVSVHSSFREFGVGSILGENILERDLVVENAHIPYKFNKENGHV